MRGGLTGNRCSAVPYPGIPGQAGQIGVVGTAVAGVQIDGGQAGTVGSGKGPGCGGMQIAPG